MSAPGLLAGLAPRWRAGRPPGQALLRVRLCLVPVTSDFPGGTGGARARRGVPMHIGWRPSACCRSLVAGAEPAGPEEVRGGSAFRYPRSAPATKDRQPRSEEPTAAIQSHFNLVCRLLLENKT